MLKASQSVLKTLVSFIISRYCKRCVVSLSECVCGRHCKQCVMSLSECVCGCHCKQCVVSLSECVCSRHCKQCSWHACQPTVTFTLYCCIVCQFVIIMYVLYVSLCFAVVTVAAQTAPAVAVSVGIIIPLIIVSAMIVIILAGVVFYNKL